MKSKSEKYRELLEEEKRLRNQLMDCETAQSRMLKKAFNGLGLKMGFIGELVNDQSVIKIIEATGDHVRYFRKTGDLIESYEISVEDLFDAEVK
jgi:hypothetical protein